MTKTQALKLKPGDKARVKGTGAVFIVDEIQLWPTGGVVEIRGRVNGKTPETLIHFDVRSEDS